MPKRPRVLRRIAVAAALLLVLGGGVLAYQQGFGKGGAAEPRKPQQEVVGAAEVKGPGPVTKEPEKGADKSGAPLAKDSEGPPLPPGGWDRWDEFKELEAEAGYSGPAKLLAPRLEAYRGQATFYATEEWFCKCYGESELAKRSQFLDRRLPLRVKVPGLREGDQVRVLLRCVNYPRLVSGDRDWQAQKLSSGKVQSEFPVPMDWAADELQKWTQSDVTLRFDIECSVNGQPSTRRMTWEAGYMGMQVVVLNHTLLPGTRAQMLGWDQKNPLPAKLLDAGIQPNLACHVNAFDPEVDKIVKDIAQSEKVFPFGDLKSRIRSVLERSLGAMVVEFVASKGWSQESLTEDQKKQVYAELVEPLQKVEEEFLGSERKIAAVKSYLFLWLVFEAVDARGIMYQSLTQGGGVGRSVGLQRVRSPGQVVTEKAGNCFDTSCLFASVLEAHADSLNFGDEMNVWPQLAYPHNHAISVVGFPLSPVGHWVPIETTVLGKSGAALETIKKQGAEYLASRDTFAAPLRTAMEVLLSLRGELRERDSFHRFFEFIQGPRDDWECNWGTVFTDAVLLQSWNDWHSGDERRVLPGVSEWKDDIRQSAESAGRHIPEDWLVRWGESLANPRNTSRADLMRYMIRARFDSRSGLTKGEIEKQRMEKEAADSEDARRKAIEKTSELEARQKRLEVKFNNLCFESVLPISVLRGVFLLKPMRGDLGELKPTP